MDTYLGYRTGAQHFTKLVASAMECVLEQLFIDRHPDVYDYDDAYVVHVDLQRNRWSTAYYSEGWYPDYFPIPEGALTNKFEHLRKTL